MTAPASCPRSCQASAPAQPLLATLLPRDPCGLLAPSLSGTLAQSPLRSRSTCWRRPSPAAGTPSLAGRSRRVVCPGHVPRRDWFLSPIWAEPASCSPSPAAWASSANGTRCQLCGRHVGGGLGAGPWRLPGTTPQATRPCRAPRTHSTSLQPPCSTPTRRILSLKTGLPGRPVWLSGAAWA